jgi:hypothetical protein
VSRSTRVYHENAGEVYNSKINASELRLGDKQGCNTHAAKANFVAKNVSKAHVDHEKPLRISAGEGRYF